MHFRNHTSEGFYTEDRDKGACRWNHVRSQDFIVESLVFVNKIVTARHKPQQEQIIPGIRPRSKGVVWLAAPPRISAQLRPLLGLGDA